LDIIVRAVTKEGYLRATMTPEPADAFLIAVPTPFNSDNHTPNVKYIESACKSIAPVLKSGDTVILESTSPVGTTERVSEWLAENRSDLTFPHTHGEESDIRVAHCPERVLPGRVLYELVHNDRILGGITPKCAQKALELYSLFVEGECILTDARTAEMAKLTENCYRDVNIAFANELSVLCEKFSIDVWELIRLANRHPRVDILKPGPGVGGHCIAVDPWFIASQAPQEAKLIRTAREVNDSKPGYVLDSIIGRAKEQKTKRVTCLGATFKADIDDLRESPSLTIVQGLAQQGYEIDLVEPHVTKLPECLPNSSCRLVTLEDALVSSEKSVFALLVAHKEFRESDDLATRDTLVFCDFCK
jgi:UDP-N-acetyl-D-mannosaminuronic acid dehydrogenase